MTARNYSYDQLTSVGFSLNDIRTHLRTGALTKVRRGVYTQAAADDDLVAWHRRLIQATVPLTDEVNTLSHTSAAILHGLPVRNKDLDVVTMTRLTSGHADASPVLRVRDTRIDPYEITTLDGLRITTLARTVADQARTLPYEWGLITTDAALRQGLSRSELELILAGQRRLHGRPKALGVAQWATELSESPAESLSRARMHQLGLPTPELQTEFFDHNGVFVARCDFFWEEYGLIGEVDGESKYDTHLKPGQTAAQAVMNEKERENALRDLGFWVIRWGWKEAMDKQELHRRIQAGIQLATRRTAR